MQHSSALSAQDDVARRSQELLKRLKPAKKQKLNVSVAPKKSDVALLPEERALALLREHRIVKMFNLNAVDVHTI